MQTEQSILRIRSHELNTMRNMALYIANTYHIVFHTDLEENTGLYEKKKRKEKSAPEADTK